MRRFKQIVIALNLFLFLGTLGALLGTILSFVVVGELFRTLYPGTVTDSAQCGHGGFAGFCALVGGAIAGWTVGCYAASKLLFRDALLRSLSTALEHTVAELEWDTTLGRRFRCAVHSSCAGSAVVAFAGIGDAATALIILPLGFLGVIAGNIAFIRALFSAWARTIEPTILGEVI